MEISNDTFLTDMERDVIGEVMNISLGSSATSLSSLLNKRVEITVPKVEVVSAYEFNFDNLEPAVGVEIKYIKGITGDNIMILKKLDVKLILDTLMGTETPIEEFQLDEIAMSAVCEVMNQMMGSAATALADFLGRRVDISTPVAYEIIDKDDFKGRYFSDNDNIVQVKFDLKVGEVINSEFINVISVPLAKEMVSLFLAGTGLNDDDNANSELDVVETNSEPMQQTSVAEENIKKEPTIRADVNEKPVQPKAKSKSVEEYIDDDDDDEEPVVRHKKNKGRKVREYYDEDDDYEDDDYDDYEERYRRKQERRPKKRKEPVNVTPMQYESFDDEEDDLTEEQKTNLGLIMSVPLQVSVEIGRTKKKIKEILEFQQGTIVELDKQAGAQVDIIINGQVIAKGDVVVVNDNFGVRVTEIVKKDEIVKITM